MILWRLSGAEHARSFDGGYGLHFNGRWNTVGHPVTYCGSSQALCVLEKLVHVEDPDLLPELVIARYDVPEFLGIMQVEFADLPDSWTKEETWSQEFGDAWHEGLQSPLLKVPSAIVPISQTPDFNMVINHRHPDGRRISLLSTEPFVLDSRFF